MTISSTTRIAGPYTGSGTTGPFTFAFKVFQASDLVVVKREISTATDTTLTLTTDYSVTLNGNQNSSPGGSVTLVSSISSAYELTLTSSISNLQPTDLTNQGGFYPEVITDALDRACIQIQQLASLNTRSLVAPISDGLGTSLALPAADLRANKYLAFDANGVPMAADGTDTPNITSAGDMTITANNAGSNVARDVIFYDNATETMRINRTTTPGSTRVGVGTATPAGTLGVGGDVYIGNQLSSGTSGTMRLVSSAGVNYIQSGTSSAATSAPFVISAIGGGGDWMRVTNSSVTIGASGTASDLTVYTTATSTANANAGATICNSGNTRQINLGVDDTNSTTWIQGWIPGTGASSITLQPTDGNVGLGTTAPTASLDVASGSSPAVFVRAGAGGALASSAGAGLKLEYSTASDIGLIQAYNYATTTAKPLALNSGGGDVGIGTTAPGSRLDVNGGQIRVRAAGSYSEANANCGALYYDTTGGTFTMDARSTSGSTAISFRTSSGGTGAERMKVLNSGAVGITQLAGTGNRAVYSDASGYLTNTSSDGTLKTNVVTVTDGASIVAALRPVRFDWIDQQTRGAQREVGLIAQEVQTVLPEVVGINNDGTLTVDYSHVVSVLIGAVQTLQAKVAALEANA